MFGNPLVPRGSAKTTFTSHKTCGLLRQKQAPRVGLEPTTLRLTAALEGSLGSAACRYDILLSAEVPGAEALRIQAQSARAAGYCGCGCPSIGLEVDRERAQQAVLASRPAAKTHNDPEDPEHTLWLILWAEDGWLSYLEIAWISEQAPQEFPSPESFESCMPPSAGQAKRT